VKALALWPNPVRLSPFIIVGSSTGVMNSVVPTKMDRSPICFMIGRREVIAGLERGVIGMRVGGCRTLVVSPHLAYRDKGVEGSIPPNAVLRFEVELIDVKDVDKPMG